MQTIYLDHNATTPLLPGVWEAMSAAPPGNPSSAHAAGRAARRALDDARERVAALLGAQPDEVTFTSGATEANNLAIFGFTSLAKPQAAVAFASHIEHPCVIEPLRQLEARGAKVEWLAADARGVVRGSPSAASLFCLMLANHETGAVQPVRDVARTLPPGAHLHCDAVQAVGKIPVSFRDLGATTLSLSAHKFGGPKGVGALLVRRGTALAPLTFGGHQQQGRRPGTEPVALVAGTAAALELAARDLEANRAKAEHLRARFWAALERTCAPVVLNGPEIGAADVIPTTLNVSFPGCRADLLLMALDLAGVACSTGSACSSGSLLPSPVLRAMGVSDERLRSALRFSFAPTQPPEEPDEAARRVAECVARVRGG
ncbi:MAG: cysteine desulfurase [Planctomycetes bacterium]|nr:cysteine desulfurase [Planctomycetota bacterium]